MGVLLEQDQAVGERWFNNSEIKFIEEPEKKMGAITFGVWADSIKIEEYKNKLKTVLDTENITYTNRFYFFGYTPSFDFF